MAMGAARPAAGQASEGTALGGGPAPGSAGAAMQGLEGMLRGMERTGRTDPALLGKIAGLRRAVDGARSRWETSGCRGWFSICQVAFKLGLVLDKMAEGIRSEMDGGRPGIASDSLSVLPTMYRAMEIVLSDEADSDRVGDALDVVGDLINCSDDAGLGTSTEELDRMTDWDEWSRVMPDVMKRLESQGSAPQPCPTTSRL